MTYQKKKVSRRERFKNTSQAFFDDAGMYEKNSLEYVPPETINATEENSLSSENTRKVLNILRQVLLFFPAAFVLFFASIAFTARFIFPLPEGVSRISFLGLLMFLGLALTTILGLGDLRNPKHLSIPLSIISVGVTLGLIGTVFFDWFGFGYFLRNYVPYFFPLAFIAPVLAKNWVDRIGTDETN